MKLHLQNFSDAVHQKLQIFPDCEVSRLPLHRIHDFLRRKPFRAICRLSNYGMDRAAALLSIATNVVKPSRCFGATLLAWSSKLQASLAALLSCIGGVKAVPRRLVIIRHALRRLEELASLKQHAGLSGGLNAFKATGLSNVSIHLILNGKPVYDEGAILDNAGTFSISSTYTLQVELLGGSGKGADEVFRAVSRK